MSCSLEDIRNDGIASAAKVFKGTATAIKQEGNMMRIPFGDHQAIKNKAAATFLAERQAVKVQEWAEKKFSKIYSTGWTEIDKTMSDVIRIAIKFPKSLYESYKVKKGMQTMAEMEANLLGEVETPNVVEEVVESEVKFEVPTKKDTTVELENNLKELNKVDNQEGVENLRESMLRDFDKYYPQYSDLAQWEKETMIDMMMEGELITYC